MMYRLTDKPLQESWEKTSSLCTIVVIDPWWPFPRSTRAVPSGAKAGLRDVALPRAVAERRPSCRATGAAG